MAVSMRARASKGGGLAQTHGNVRATVVGREYSGQPQLFVLVAAGKEWAPLASGANRCLAPNYFLSALAGVFSDLAALPPTPAAGMFFEARRLIRPSMPSCFTTASNSER